MNYDQPSRSNPNAAAAANPPSSRPTVSGQTASSGGSKDMRAQIGDAVSKLGDIAQQAGGQAKDAALSLTSDANKKAAGLLNAQFSTGADFAGNIAEAVKSAADSLDRNAPQLAGFVRSAAQSVEEFSSDIRGQTVQQLVKTASDYTRKQPALVFGLASLAGFALFRVLKSNTPTDGVPASRGGSGHRAGQSYGS
jgi:ABC-type transporter Mla subunit MlaD